MERSAACNFIFNSCERLLLLLLAVFQCLQHTNESDGAVVWKHMYLVFESARTIKLRTDYWWNAVLLATLSTICVRGCCCCCWPCFSACNILMKVMVQQSGNTDVFSVSISKNSFIYDRLPMERSAACNFIFNLCARLGCCLLCFSPCNILIKVMLQQSGNTDTCSLSLFLKNVVT